MENKILIPCLVTVLMMMSSSVSADFDQDKKECKDQLISLSPCITFVSGDAKAPTAACCGELQRDSEKSKYCLCVLVKDRDEPGLGFKLNATRAMSLVAFCRVASIARACPELLHLPANSPEAQFFEQFGNISSVLNTSSAGETVPSSSTKLNVKGIRQATIIGLMIFALLSVASSGLIQQIV